MQIFARKYKTTTEKRKKEIGLIFTKNSVEACLCRIYLHNVLYSVREYACIFVCGQKIMIRLRATSDIQHPFNPRTYRHNHTPTVVRGGGYPPTWIFSYFTIFCDVLYKMRDILWDVTLLGACNVTNLTKIRNYQETVETEIFLC